MLIFLAHWQKREGTRKGGGERRERYRERGGDTERGRERERGEAEVRSFHNRHPAYVHKYRTVRGSCPCSRVKRNVAGERRQERWRREKKRRRRGKEERV